MTTFASSSSSKLQLAVDSVHVLSRAFWAAVTGNDSHAAALDEDSPCPILSDGRTLFYFDTTTASQNDACGGLDWYILAYLTMAVHVVSWGGRWILWEPMARAIAAANRHPNFDVATCQKVSMNMTECSFFVLSGIFAYALFAHEWWLYQPAAWLQDREELAVQAATKFYYLLYTARFVSDFVSLFFEKGRTAVTLFVSCLHHTVTLGLIAVAIYGNCIRAGAVIMFFFDWADPPLLLAKALKYLSVHPTDAFQTAANRLFELFAVTFFASRNVIYNYVAYQVIVHLEPNAVWERVGLLSLVALQTYWLVLIIQAAMRKSANDGCVEDVRENGGASAGGPSTSASLAQKEDSHTKKQN